MITGQRPRRPPRCGARRAQAVGRRAALRVEDMRRRPVRRPRQGPPCTPRRRRASTGSTSPTPRPRSTTATIRLDACSYLHDFPRRPVGAARPRHATCSASTRCSPATGSTSSSSSSTTGSAAAAGSPVLRSSARAVPAAQEAARPHRGDDQGRADLRAARRAAGGVQVDPRQGRRGTRPRHRRRSSSSAVGPGTGKSVIALNLVAELSANGYAPTTRPARGVHQHRPQAGRHRAAGQFKFFNSYLNAEEDTLDVLVCDEAHRIRKYSGTGGRKKKAEDPDRPQIDELLAVARVSVFFIDDLQAVRDEIGNSDDIERLAERSTAPRSTSSSSRRSSSAAAARTGSCGGSRTRSASAGPRTRCGPGDDNFEFDIVDSPQELEAMIRRATTRGTPPGWSPATAGRGPPALRRHARPRRQIDDWEHGRGTPARRGGLAPASRSRTCGPARPAASTRSAASTPPRGSSSTTSA
jgi:hypothetical protein